MKCPFATYGLFSEEINLTLRLFLVFAPLKLADLTAKTWEIQINFMFQIKHKTLNERDQ